MFHQFRITALAISLAAAVHAGDYGISFHYSSHRPSYAASSYSYGRYQPSGYAYCETVYERPIYTECYSPSTIVYDDCAPVFGATYTRSDCYARPVRSGRSSIHYRSGSSRGYRTYTTRNRQHRVVKKVRRYSSRPRVSLRTSFSHRDSRCRPGTSYRSYRGGRNYSRGYSPLHRSSRVSYHHSPRYRGSRTSYHSSPQRRDSRSRHHRGPRIRIIRR